MSGICGICEAGRDLNAVAVEPMLEALAISGEAERDVCGGRSAILAVARRWDFQQASCVEHISIVADADIVDRASLARGLSPSNYDLSSGNVAELVGRLYLQYGTDFLKHLHGGFSIALWDNRRQRAIIAIDRVGVKGLYWRREGNRLIFASRLAAIRAVQDTPIRVNPEAVLQFLLHSAVPAPLAIDTDVEKLRPGTFLIFERGRTSEHTYWDLEYPESENTDQRYWARELREGMRSAVHRQIEHSQSEAIGCYLSGGTDSSSVVAFASEKLHPVQSFSIAFEEAGFSEIEFARTTAARFQTRHHEKWLAAQDAADVVEKIIAFYDEPFANSSAIGSYYCARMARENGVETLLAGDGGDELFAGNERYARDKYFALYHRVPGWLRQFVIEPAVSLLPENAGKLSLPRKYVRRANIPNPRRMLSYGFFLNLAPAQVFEDGFLQQTGVENWLAIPEGHFARASASSELNRLLYLDVKMTLADNDLRKVSGTAELAGVNVRYPLLDHELAELSGRIPAELKLRGFEKRYIFKQAMKDLLPARVLHKRKHGFGVPVAQWLLRDQRMRSLMSDIMNDPQTQQRGYFRPQFFQELIRLHRAQPNFYGEIVWYLVALELWHRRHLERSRETVHAA